MLDQCGRHLYRQIPGLDLKLCSMEWKVLACKVRQGGRQVPASMLFAAGGAYAPQSPDLLTEVTASFILLGLI